MFNKGTYFKGTAFVLFLFVFCYLVIRALYTEPLHDEIATFYFYIYHGDFVGSDFVFDANNHMLNSALGYLIYRIAGEHFFAFRLPNLLSFPIYFYAVYQLMQWIKSESLKSLGIIALICIPFILEYFAYCRGYGIGIAFFVLGIYYLILHFQSDKSRFLVVAFASFWIAVFANMIFINVSLLLLALVVFSLLVKKTNRKSTLIWCLLFVVGLSPFIFFAFKLKEAGALYYGSLDGLWDVTGKSLSEMVLFSEYWMVSIILSALLVFFISKWLLLVLKRNWKERLKEPSFIITYFLTMSILMIVLLAIILQVNYPEDRTGMYLIPLFILVFIYACNHSSWFRHLQWLLLFFPISFCFHLSVHSSIYSPDQRMSEDFFKEVKAYLKPTHSLASYHMNFWTWNWMDSKEEIQSSVLLYDHYDEPIYDVILGKKETIHNPKILELYDTLAFNKLTHDVAFVRKTPLLKELLYISPEVNTWADWEYVSIFETDSIEKLPQDDPIQITVDLTLVTQVKKHYLELVVHTLDENGHTIERMNYPIAFVYRNQLISKMLLHHFVLKNVSNQTKSIKVYLWNKGNDPLEIKNGKCYLYKVKNP